MTDAMRDFVEFNDRMRKVRTMTEQKFKYQVIADNSGKWAGNGVTFDTFEEAVIGARDLASRWMLVRDWRILQRHDGDNWKVVSDPKTGKLIEDKPEHGKQYRLTGGHGDKSIANGDSWSDSEVPS